MTGEELLWAGGEEEISGQVWTLLEAPGVGWAGMICSVLKAHGVLRQGGAEAKTRL